MRRAFATALRRFNEDGVEVAEPYFVSGLVSPSADGSEWEVELVDAAWRGKHFPVSELTEKQRERAEELLCELAQRAEQEIAFGG